MKTFDQFIGLYNLNKTLRFSLKPVGRTAENLCESELLKSDEQRAKDYPHVKSLIDECHKHLINEALKADNADFDWTKLKNAIETYRKDKSENNRKALEKEQGEMRELIYKKINKIDTYKELTAATPSNLFKKIFSDPNNTNVGKDTFGRFATYFKGFQENRKNIYSDNPISTAVPYRTVNDNFPKFLTDIDVYTNIKVSCPEVLQKVEEELRPYLKGKSLDEIFDVQYYNNLLDQEGIEFFNNILGGVTIDEGEKKLRGINEFSNLYRQQHPEISNSKKALTMVPLFKQILSDRETSSFIPQAITSDEELVGTINQFHQGNTHFEINGTKVNVVDMMCKLLASIDTFDPEHIFINSKHIPKISQTVFNNWEYISTALKNKAEEMFGNKTRKAQKEVESFLKREAYSLAELSLIGEDRILTYFADIKDLQKNIVTHYESFAKAMSAKTRNLIGDENGTEVIKVLLDDYMTLLHKAECLSVSSNLDVDQTFYASFSLYYDALRKTIPVYTKARNYLTSKSYNEKKIKLTFDCPTLADGWDKNKEKDNACIILRRDGLYYLGIMESGSKKLLDKELPTGGECYEKMDYRQNKINTLLPKCTTDTKEVKHAMEHGKEIVEIYDEDKWVKPLIVSKEIYELSNKVWDKSSNQWVDKKKGNKMPKRFQEEYLKQTNDELGYNEAKTKWIEFAKEFISSYKSTASLGIQLNDEYPSVGSFYDHINEQAYNIRFVEVSASYIDALVEGKNMFLFQIYNKDYAPGAHGTKNLHTLYWEALFCKENLENTILKLNGKSELFYRAQSIETPIVHKIGEKMLNKHDKSGRIIPGSVYQELYLYFNNKIEEAKLSKEAKAVMNEVIVKDVKYEIVKDRRYTQPHFQFHIPFTINFKKPNTVRINDLVNDFLKGNTDVNIIGIDRGERNLIYISLINQKGEILMQKTFNMIGKMNYQEKLVQRERERDNARKSWKTVEKIKELKEGFLSAVIHEIATLMIENNAIVVMEDLNFGFKRGRFKVERQIYQKFEKMLIDKLNYLAFKNRNADDNGGIMHGYQLTDKFESFQQMGKQSGFLFYIPAAYTSKIDPVSGFVNIFDFKEITNAETKKRFFEKFDSIQFLSEEEGFEFTFDYSNFKTVQTDYMKRWTVATTGKRIRRINENGHNIMGDFYPTKALLDTFNKAGFTLSANTNIKEIIDSTPACKDTAEFFSELLYSFRMTLQMRNSNPATGEDYIISPIKVDGKQFNSDEEAGKGRDKNGNWISTLPVDADANGAYHIALKGLYKLNNPDKKIEHPEWLKYMQTKPYKR